MNLDDIPYDIIKIIIDYKNNIELYEKIKKVNKELKKKIEYNYGLIIENEININYSMIIIDIKKDYISNRNYYMRDIISYSLSNNKSLLIEREKEWLINEEKEKKYGTFHLEIKKINKNNKIEKIVLKKYKKNLKKAWNINLFEY